MLIKYREYFSTKMVKCNVSLLMNFFLSVKKMDGHAFQDVEEVNYGFHLLKKLGLSYMEVMKESVLGNLI